jgi:ketosteroid isomerase-like protein
MLKKVMIAVVLGVLFSVEFGRAAEAEEQVRATFEAFVKAQNAHDLKAVEALLLDSPNLLWITRGNAVWGRAEALRTFEGLYAGTWHLEPDFSNFRVVLAEGRVAQIFVPIEYSIGPAGQPSQDARFLMNQVLVKTGNAWRIANILPIPVPAPPAPSSKE